MKGMLTMNDFGLTLAVKQLRDEIVAAQKSISSVSAEAYENFVERYNEIAGSVDGGLPPRRVVDSDLSFSRVSVRAEVLDAFLVAVNALAELVQGRNRKSFHCFVINHECPKEVQEGRYKLFLATSFAPEHLAITDMIIERAERELGIPRSQIFRADRSAQTRDIMCKVCHSIRESECVICNISPTNANVHMEMGIAIGTGKLVVLLKNRDLKEKTLADIAGMEYIPYSAGDDRWWDGLVQVLKGNGVV